MFTGYKKQYICRQVRHILKFLFKYSPSCALEQTTNVSLHYYYFYLHYQHQIDHL